jgi:hypothetical protein
MIRPSPCRNRASRRAAQAVMITIACLATLAGAGCRGAADFVGRSLYELGWSNRDAQIDPSTHMRLQDLNSIGCEP